MTAGRPSALFAALAMAVAGAAPSYAQGKSGAHKKSGAPSQSELPPPTAIGGGSAAATPFSWLDDASVLGAGDASLGLSVVQWVGTSASELAAPAIDVGLGLTSRAQLTANVPYVMGGGDAAGTASAVGTSYLGVKLAVLDDGQRHMKLAVAPTLELLNQTLVSTLDPGAGRVQWGLPVSAELDGGMGRVYAGAGYFSRGVWYTGGGVAVQPQSRVALSASITRSWTSPTAAGEPVSARDRNEIAGGLYVSATPHVGVFGSVGHTFATTDANGAGLTIGGGVVLSVAAAPKK
jgi:hypothetical protein